MAVHRLGSRIGSTLCALILGGLLWSGVAQAGTASFEYTGGEQSFTVPSAVTKVDVTLIGGKGGSGATDNGFTSAGGYGSESLLKGLTVSPGQHFFVEVGGNGTFPPSNEGGAGGFNGGGAGGSSGGGSCNGGGGGGGASDIRTVTRADSDTLISRVAVAAGGGGGGGSTVGPSFTVGGAGGTFIFPGGNGGGPAGGTGGGSGAGATYQGGKGSSASVGTCGGGGGGGGGGLKGGGGGGNGSGGDSSGGGGGGGSVGTAPSGVNADYLVSGTDTTGVPSITFTWVDPPAPAQSGPTGQRAAALKKCKKQPKGIKRKKCIKKAKKLPV